MNGWDILLLAVLFAAVLGAVIHCIKRRKNGCGCGCGCCSSPCHKGKKEKTSSLTAPKEK